MKKLAFKKFILGSLIALQLSSNLSNNNLSEVYAKGENTEDIQFNENGKELHMIGIIIDKYETVTVGYVFVKDHAVYVKDAIDGRIYNFTKLSEYLQYPEIIYTEIENVLPEELKNRKSITKEEAIALTDEFFITNQTVKLWGMDDLFDYTYETFGAAGFDNEGLHITNCGIFDDPDDVFHSWTVTDDYQEELEIIDGTENNYKLGLLEVDDSYPIYSNIYSDEAIREEDKMGIITRYYVFDADGRRIKTLKTQEQVDEFICTHEDELDNYKWKASFYNGKSVDKILDAIENNQPISYETTTYFIDYKPKV